MNSIKSHQIITKLLSLALILAFVVITLGAYTRLTNAGLGCPDWPGCYGHIIAPKAAAFDSHGASWEFNSTKAWTEMVHRYIAGTLGLLVFTIIVLSFYNIMTNTNKISNNKSKILLLLGLIATIIFQALLGKYTVTMKLFPPVVMGHLLGGFTTISLLLLLLLSHLEFKTVTNLKHYISPSNKFSFLKAHKLLKISALLSLVAVIIQIILGGWTSANYAAVPCLDFPSCNGQYLPTLDTLQAMNPFYQSAADYLNYEGGLLSNPMRVTIQLFHRWGALLVSFLLLTTIYSLRLDYNNIDNHYNKKFSIWLISLLILQITLGLINVKYVLPLFNAVLHNAVACVILLSLVVLNYRINSKNVRI